MDRPRSLFEKIWDDHVVRDDGDGSVLLYVDRILLHEISSPQAFDALRRSGDGVNRPETVIAVADHDVPTLNRDQGITDDRSRLQVETLARNCDEFGAIHFAPEDPRHGITHVIAPELGAILPGSIAVACDSHATTYGAFGAIGFGIGATEVESVLRSNALPQTRPGQLLVVVHGELGHGVSAKDLILAVIGVAGMAAGTGRAVEYAGPGVQALSMEARMTLCNMSIEMGARAGLIAPDETTFAYLADRSMTPKGGAWTRAIEAWRKLQSDPGAQYDREVEIDATDLEPQVTWGTSPEEVASISACVPSPTDAHGDQEAAQWSRALDYMGLTPGTPLRDIAIDRVFIGSCTNGRLEDLIAAADVARGRRVQSGVDAMVVPGSAAVKRAAEEIGLDRIFIEAGFSWRDAGCSMCNALNGDELRPGERCASTSNRNFEHRQGRDGRTHLMSPAMAAAAAVTGRLTDVRELL